MIDTDKYEGHSPAPWKLHYDDSAIDDDYLVFGAQIDPVGALHHMSVANAQLVADAPLLLEEVKRLHKLLLTHDVCPTCGCYADNDFSLDCCKTWGLGE